MGQWKQLSLEKCKYEKLFPWENAPQENDFSFISKIWNRVPKTGKTQMDITCSLHRKPKLMPL